MANNLEIYETMCAYFDGELSLEEEKKFLEMVEKDPELKKEFEWEEKMIFNSIPNYQELTEPASDAGIAAYSGVDNTPAHITKTKAKYLFYKTWAIAASIIAICFLLYLLLVHPKKQSGEIITDNKPGKETPAIPPVKTLQDSLNRANEIQKEIAAREIMKKKVNNLGRHEPDLSVESPQLGQLQEAFATKDYAVIPAFSEESFLVRGGDNEREIIKAYALFYKGIAFLELNKDSAAVSTLKKVIGLKNIPAALSAETAWNLSKAYYKSGNKEEARSLLNELLTRKNFPYVKEGKVLLDLINEKTE